MTAHSELLARLEGASEGSRELDAAIWYAVHEPDVDYPGIHTEQTEQGPREVLTCELGSKWADDVGRYSTSLDAALALAERVLPGWEWLLRTDEGRGFMLNCWRKGDEPNMGDPCFPTYAPTPALALCIAILKATASECTKHGEGDQ